LEVIVYTANIGGYDTFKEPNRIIPNARYLMFTDQDYSSDVWEVVKVRDDRHQRTVARDIKINAHKWLPNHDISIWIDHSFAPNISKAIELPNNTVMCYAHESRDCIYLEVMELLRLGHINNDKADRLLELFTDNNYPAKNGLSSSGFMVRGNTERFNKKWWALVNKYCERDQATQHLAAKLTNTIMLRPPQGISVYDNPYLKNRARHVRSNKF